MSLRLPTKREIAGVVIFAIGAYVALFQDQHEGRHWGHVAGLAAWMLFGVVLFVGQDAIDTAKSFIGLAGYAKRELKRRSTKAVRVEDPDDDKPVNDQ